MSAEKETPLKVCQTCHHWSYEFKGLCRRLGQGVGRFWTCEDWTEKAGSAQPSAAETPTQEGACKR